jgi:hypothetical protein
MLALCMTLVTLTMPAVATADGSADKPSPLMVPSQTRLSIGDTDHTAPAFALQPARQTNRRANIWISSRLGFLVGAAGGAGWGLKKTLADDDHPSAIAGYTALGGMAGLGVGAIVGAVWPSRTHGASGGTRVQLQPVVSRQARGMRLAMSF